MKGFPLRDLFDRWRCRACWSRHEAIWLICPTENLPREGS